MAIVQPLTVDARNYRVNGLLLGRIWRLTKPYWNRSEAWRSWLIVIFLLCAVVLSSLIGAAITYRVKALTDALIARQQHAFELALFGYVAFWMLQQYLPVLMSVADVWLAGNWRRWLTTNMVDNYLEHRTYYDIALKDDLDNPDQRLQDSTKPFIDVITGMPRTVLTQSGTVIASTVILMSLDRTMAWLILGCSMIQVTVQSLLIVPTVKLQFQSTVAEADLRYGLTHVRENAEAVAFYHGEAAERAHILDRLGRAIRRQVKAAYYQDSFIPFVVGFFYISWLVIPYLLLSPRVMSGELTYGSVAQAAAAGSLIQSSLTMVFSFFVQQLANAAPPAVRLAQIQERLEELRADRASEDSRRLVITRNTEVVQLDKVSLETPGGEQQLVKDLTLCVDGDTNLAIVGQTGVGKSSLLRVMAGLWTRGEGRLEMPPPEHCMFLPQRPYMILADLRSQLLYPHGIEVDDAELIEVLEAVNLHHLVEQHGGLSAVRDWGRVLSLGEQQRIAFARIMISKPRFVFLDEATSAVDYATETRLYRLLATTGASYISIGHRLSILDHHTHILTLKAEGAWSLEPHLRAEADTETAVLS